ncbi:MAG: hypothetical protein GY772_08185 [bacterium]|nr:hypothetical protein [bacterium]
MMTTSGGHIRLALHPLDNKAWEMHDKSVTAETARRTWHVKLSRESLTIKSSENKVYVALALTFIEEEVFPCFVSPHCTIHYALPEPSWPTYWRTLTIAKSFLHPREVPVFFTGRSHSWLLHPDCELYGIVRVLYDVFGVWASTDPAAKFVLDVVPPPASFRFHVTWQRLA